MATPLSPFENKARIHAHLGFFAFVVGLPLGILISRYLRTFTKHWFWPHAIVNLFFVGPLVFATFALGYQLVNTSGIPHFFDVHQKVGLALLILYIIQVCLGVFIHFIKLPASVTARIPGGRPPQNYLHGLLGLSIVLLACWQTHYGLWHEWAFITGNAHPVNWRCKHFWLGFVTAVWAIYLLGLLLLPRQYKQERQNRKEKSEGSNDGVPLI
ncbi:Cytochrome b561 domain-containing protein [Mycena indigotica]|uniref:Cytochrome b561 domain-containing protein n=1 Tax=Mycena indigotica TaxID=2126181 RepID=A0A8H6WFJ3_9AGAR|nr:Cytochrome b561 domain-containing protein [Mycena indigotica]KAF7315842.1 Cytochrome b561 domain-containing protein [Mycena indigotica]